jgi:hypothetical protein
VADGAADIFLSHWCLEKLDGGLVHSPTWQEEEEAMISTHHRRFLGFLFLFVWSVVCNYKSITLFQ